MSEKRFVPDLENQNVDDIVNQILESVPKEDVKEIRLPTLASELYGLTDSVVHLRPMTFADEKAIMAAKGSKILNTLLERCIQENINPRSLLFADKLYLTINLRSISIGNKYEFEIACTKCEHKAVTEVDVLESFPVVYAEEPIEKTKKVTLPIANKEVIVKRATSGELEDLGNNMLEELWRFVLDISGHTNAKVRAQVLNKLPRKDVHFLLNEITLPNLGIDQKFIYKCAKCSHEELRELQLTQDFFTMN